MEQSRGLAPGITIENILLEQASRNPYSLLILHEAGYVEAFGQGLATVTRVLDNEGLPLPKFHDTGNSFVASVFGRQRDISSGEGIFANLSESQRKILSHLRVKAEATPREIRDLLADRAERSIQRDLKGFVDAGLIEAVGEIRSLHYRLGELGS